MPATMKCKRFAVVETTDPTVDRFFDRYEDALRYVESKPMSRWRQLDIAVVPPHLVGQDYYKIEDENRSIAHMLASFTYIVDRTGRFEKLGKTLGDLEITDDL